MAGLSTLGQKQTFAPQKVMSALPLKADIVAARMSDMSNDSTRASYYPALMAAAPSL